MGSLIEGIRFCANRQLKNTVIPALRHKYVHHCSSNKVMYYLQSQQRLLQIVQYCVSNFCLCNFIKTNNARDFSITSDLLAKSKNRGEKKQKTQHIDYTEFEQVVDVNKLISQLDNAIEKLKDDFIQYLSVRSSVGAIEMLSVKFDGKDFTLQELAQINRKPKLIVLNVSTFPQAIPDILKSLTKNQMKLNPQQDGTIIYVPIPK